MLVAVPHRPGRPGQFDRLGFILRADPAFADDSGVVRGGANHAAVPAESARPGVFGAVRTVTVGIINGIAELPTEARDAVDDGRPEPLLIGPIGIARLCGQAAKSGWLALVALTAVISLGLAVTNLLPIPIADGGQVCILAGEAICRRDASIRTRIALAVAGIVILVALMATATFFDLR